MPDTPVSATKAEAPFMPLDRDNFDIDDRRIEFGSLPTIAPMIVDEAPDSTAQNKTSRFGRLLATFGSLGGTIAAALLKIGLVVPSPTTHATLPPDGHPVIWAYPDPDVDDEPLAYGFGDELPTDLSAHSVLASSDLELLPVVLPPGELQDNVVDLLASRFGIDGDVLRSLVADNEIRIAIYDAPQDDAVREIVKAGVLSVMVVVLLRAARTSDDQELADDILTSDYFNYFNLMQRIVAKQKSFRSDFDRLRELHLQVVDRTFAVYAHYDEPDGMLTTFAIEDDFEIDASIR